MIRTMMSWKTVGRACLSFGGEIVAHRSFSKKIIPRLPVASDRTSKRIRAKKERAEDEEYEREVRREAKEAYDQYGDVPDPDIEALRKAPFQQVQDYQRLDLKFKREKAFRKNFKSLVEKELNLLTYAEKEKIRFLHEQSPDEWTPETLSQAFPISPEGVVRVLKSTFKARSLKEIQGHDQRVVETIEKVKSGEIQSNPELEERIKMRQQVPFIAGAVGPNGTKMLMKAQAPLVLGEFARLVAPPEMLEASLTDQMKSAPIPAAISDSADPKDGDSFMLKTGKEASNELRQVNISAEKRMTLSEFKSNLKDVNQPNSSEIMTASDAQDANNLVHQSNEIKYLKNYTRIDDNPNTHSVPSEDAPIKYEDEDYLNYHSISKYKTSVRQELETRGTEMRDPQDSKKSHTQQRYEIKDSWSPENIDVPPEMKRPGAVYKQGKSYYDENGIFLYRVV